jgi:hypothetical protein
MHGRNRPARRRSGELIMKRLVWLVVGLLGLASRGFAFDGPAPLVYDHTLDSIRVEFTVQGQVFASGYTKFTMAAHVPVLSSHVGQQILLQAYQYTPTNPEGDQLIYFCSFTPTAANVGQTVVYNCDGFRLLLTTETTTVKIYPRVRVASTTPGDVRDHNGQSLRLSVPLAGDDAREQNDTILTASSLGTISSSFNQSGLS